MKKILLLFIFILSTCLNAQTFTYSNISLDSYPAFNTNEKVDFHLMQSRKKPKLKFSNIAGEAFLGLALGYVAAVTLKPEDEGLNSIFSSPVQVLGIFAGTTGGVFLMGSLDRETANIAITAGGAIVSGFIFGEIGRMDNMLDIEDVIYRFVVPGATLGAILGFNFTRKYKKKKSIFNFYNNSIEIGIPEIKINKISKRYIYQLSLLNYTIN